MRKSHHTNVNNNPFSRFKGINVLLPIIIGLLIVGWLFSKEFNPQAFTSIQITYKTVLFLAIAFCCMAIRDFGYMLRLRILTDGRFSWRQVFRVIMLWEFTSAVTPSAVGGTSIAILYVNKEGLSLGRSSAVVMATSFLDELYFVLIFPILLLIVNPIRLFSVSDPSILLLEKEFLYFAAIGYGLKLSYVLLVSYGLFINPRGLKWLLLQIFRLPLLRRWRPDVNDLGYDLKINSDELKQKPFAFWLKSFGSTFFSWTARYWVVNALLLAFFVIPSFGEHFLIFARQLVMWIMQLVSPTPGGSGFAELIFTRYLGEFIPVEANVVGVWAITMALLWRIISYYPYLIMGALILPKWIREKFASNEERDV